MLAATWPTSSLSMPLMMTRVGWGTSKVMPGGASTGTGWLNPRANSSFEGPWAVARYPTPTISSSLVNPVDTPVTMLATSERVRPCSARFCRSSSGRSTIRVASSWRTVISPGRSRSSCPCGPLTAMRPPLIVTLTPEGTVIGLRPTRLIAASSPHVAQDLTTDPALARLPVGHEPLAGRQHGNAEPAEHARQVIGLRVDPQARLGHAPQSGDGPAAVRRVLHLDLEDAAGPLRIVVHRVPGDVALPLEQGGQVLLQLGGGHRHRLVHRHVGVAH